MSKDIVTSDDGTKFEVKDDGTLKEVTSSGGGIIGALVDAGTNVVTSVVEAVLPSGKK